MLSDERQAIPIDMDRVELCECILTQKRQADITARNGGLEILDYVAIESDLLDHDPIDGNWPAGGHHRSHVADCSMRIDPARIVMAEDDVTSAGVDEEANRFVADITADIEEAVVVSACVRRFLPIGDG